MNLIEKSNKNFSEVKDMAKETVEEIINNLKNELNIKNIVDITRNSLRNELYLTYQKKEDEISRLAKEEINKANQEIKEESAEIGLNDSESKSKSSSKSSS